jgi:asparagine synthetase B (glutamine-hydrolysing)
MCGIFGIIIKPGVSVPASDISKALRKIAIASESRGKDSSGIAFRTESDRTIRVIKGDIPIRELLRSREFKSSLSESLDAFNQERGFTAFGHARLVTNGTQLHEVNNQPVIKEGIFIIHNGIIVNVEDLWKKHPELQRNYSIDTEIIPSLIRKGLSEGNCLDLACVRCFNELEGNYSIAAMFGDLGTFLLATNNGSLYYITDSASFIIFSSESHYLRTILGDPFLKSFPGHGEICQLKANQGMLIGLADLNIRNFDITIEPDEPVRESFTAPYEIHKQILENTSSRHEVVIDPAIYQEFTIKSSEGRLLQYNHDAISKLKRCTRCILPETFPYIEFDERGVCNYCNNYRQKNQPKPMEELLAVIEPYKRKDGGPDCLIPFSGGRDSSYTLHFVKKELGMNPIAFTYDWGMVTDLARRNASRVCGKLGVENIIVAADIRFKRENIRKNVSAWLKRPRLGMVPLFMAGDKYFFYYSNKVLTHTNLHLSIWGSNPLENTDFKSGFAGIKPQFGKKRIDELNLGKKIRLGAFFANNYLFNPAFINSSMHDTFGAFTSRYLIKRHGYIQLFDYITWDENVIDDLIINEYKWEKSIDTSSTWRIGDGTAAFYNYIYYTVAGFSEFDTFRSNQIREDQLSREKALELVYEENHPRYENLRWYLDIIGMDFESTVNRINHIPKLYRCEI